jgi:uncharacterized membrane-anchored protein
MAFFKRAKDGAPTVPITGPVRLPESPSSLDSVRSGDIVVVTASDISTDAAKLLVEAKVAAIINTVPSFSGQVPAAGPEILVASGIAVIDDTGTGIRDLLRNGDILTITTGEITRDGELIATGVRQTQASVAAQVADSVTGVVNRVDSIAVNATEHLRRERAMLLDGSKIPHLEQPLTKRAAIVVSDTFDAKDDFKRLKRFIQDNDPAIIAIGSAADLVIAAGFTPEVTIAGPEEFSSAAVAKSRQLVVVAPDGRIPTPERFEKGGAKPIVFPSSSPAVDLAILLADTNGAAAIIHVGAAPDLATFIESDPVDAGAHLMTRLRASTKLVDAKTVAYFQTQRLGWFAPLFLLLCALIALTVAISLTPLGDEWTGGLQDQASSFFSWFKGLFS